MYQFSMAIAGALQDALSQHYNDHIRELRETGDLQKVGAFDFLANRIPMSRGSYAVMYNGM